FILEIRGLYILNRRELQKDIVDTSLYIWDDASLIPFADSLLLAYELRRSLVVFNLNQHSFSRIALPVFDMKQDDKGRTYLFVKDKGLLLLKNLVRSGDTWKTETELFASPEYNYNQIGSFLIDRRGNFWLYEQFKSLIKISPEKKLSRFSESNGLPGLGFSE